MSSISYFDYFKTLLAPLRLYDLERGYGAKELELLGGRLDEVFEYLEDNERESIVVTAESFGLDAYEKLLPYRPVAPDIEARRAAVAALLRIDGQSFTAAALSDTIQGCGVRASVREGESSQTVEVRFPDIVGAPEDFESLQSRIEQILPCHLRVEYIFAYITWALLETEFPTWGALAAAGLSWKELEVSALPMGDE